MASTQGTESGRMEETPVPPWALDLITQEWDWCVPKVITPNSNIYSVLLTAVTCFWIRRIFSITLTTLTILNYTTLGHSQSHTDTTTIYFWKLPIMPSSSSTPTNSHSPFPHPQPLTSIHLLSASMDLPILEVSFIFLLKYHWSTTLCSFLLYSQLIQLYTYTHSYFIFFSIMVYPRRLNIVPCAIQ